MNTKNEHKILINKVIQYFTDELGYPQANIFSEEILDNGSKATFDIVIYLFGKPKFIIEVKNIANENLLNYKNKLKNHAESSGIPYYK